MLDRDSGDAIIQSLPTRGVWIEMAPALDYDALADVAPHTGSVD